ncbi:MAG TPA: PRC-barrel domain-containing protein [Bryobacteraceae bacterium]|nr:PRC-barrel domain-containing protein [Bryobacteraceae bacterium]
MSTSQFENSRISEGTLRTGTQGNGGVGNESRAISRDDVRDGSASPTAFGEDNPTMTLHGGNSRVLAASALAGGQVKNSAGENVGNIEEIMLDLERGCIAYALLLCGGFLGIGDKLFAVPWSTLRIGESGREFILDVDRETLKKAPAFDRRHWPDMADPVFGRKTHKHYGKAPYWEPGPEIPLPPT